MPTSALTIVVAESDYDVNHEKSFHRLNQLGFVRGVTPLDQWYLLVNEGWKNTKMPMNESVRDYLVTMLHRYSGHTNLLQDLSAFNHMAYMFGIFAFEKGAAQDVADKCLQCAAFFPEMSAYRHEMKSQEYIIEIGQSLYGDLSREAEGKDDWFSTAYKAMSESFVQAMLILRSTCPRLMVPTKSKGGGHLMNTDARAREIGKTMGEIEQVIFDGLAPFGNTAMQ